MWKALEEGEERLVSSSICGSLSFFFSHSLEKTTRDAILADYQRLEYGQEAVDPYKLVLYKVVGRCALNKKTVSDIIVTTEDYMWLQVCLSCLILKLERV